MHMKHFCYEIPLDLGYNTAILAIAKSKSDVSQKTAQLTCEWTDHILTVALCCFFQLLKLFYKYLAYFSFLLKTESVPS